jgi:hypothetical protein
LKGKPENKKMALQLGALRAALNRPAGIETKVTVLAWMVGTLVPLNIALTAGTLWVVLGLASKLGVSP